MHEKPQDRTAPAKALVEAFGGHVQAYYFCFGPYDGLAICDFPDDISAVAMALRATSTGAFSAWETTHLLTAKDAEAAMQKSHDAKVVYAAPNT